MSAKTTIEWTKNDDGSAGRTWNVVTGCDKVSPGCDHCLAPGTRVLRADMRWVPIEDVGIGDRLVSFTETPAVGQNRVWEEAEVLAVWEVEKPTVEIELANGASFAASEDHKWLIARRGASTWWRETLSLNFKTELRTIRCEPTDTETDDYRAGYIAGATDGDGTFRWAPGMQQEQQVYWRIAKPVRDQVVLERVARFLEAFGVEVAIKAFDAGRSKFTDNPLPMAKVETRRDASLALIAELCIERGTREWMAGWLAGMFDTDASYSAGNLRYCQAKPNDVLERVVRYGKELGFEFNLEEWANNCPGARLVGGIPENIAFLAAISPELTRRCRDFYGKRTEVDATPVTGIRRGPVRRLIDITTTTGTFVAEGALTHNCYAENIARRFAGGPGFPNGFAVTVHPERLAAPLRWRKPTRVFVNSMSDMFHAGISDELIAKMFAVMAATPQHTYQILSKRHGRMRSLLSSPAFVERFDAEFLDLTVNQCPKLHVERWGWPLPNVHLGVSCEDQQWANIRIPALLDTPAAVRFISAEPLLGPIDLAGPLVDGLHRPRLTYWLTGRPGWGPEEVGPTGVVMQGLTVDPRLDWVIVGAESGPGARPMNLDWVRLMRDECIEQGVAFFFKQDAINGKKIPTPELDGKVWVEMPRMPEAVAAS